MKHIKKLATRNGNKGTEVINTEKPKPLLQNKTAISVTKLEPMNPLINILTRTSGRPNGFKRCHESILNQTYKNVKHIVSIDDVKDEEYVKLYNVDYVLIDKDKVSNEKDIPDPKTGKRFIFNLYFNILINKVEDGWVIFLDDDDYLTDKDVLQKIVSSIRGNTEMILWQMKYPNGGVLPSVQELGTTPRLARIGAPCFAVHSAIAKTIRWDGWKCGDFRFIQKVWMKTQVKRVIKETLVSLGGVGLGMRGDLGQNPPIMPINIRKNGELNSSDILKSFKANHNISKEVVNIVSSPSEREKYDAVLIMSTYKRFDFLNKILSQLVNEQTKYKVKIIIYSDGNPIEHLNAVKEVYNDIEFIFSPENNGKKYYWRTISTLFKATEKYDYDYLIQLDDDHEPINSFFDNLIDEYRKLGQKQVFKILINENYTDKRWGMANWVDGGTAYPRAFIEKIHYSVPKIDPMRWKKNPSLGSGVWEQVSILMNKYGFTTHSPKMSLLNHLGYKDSIMNTELRKKQHIQTKNFNKEWKKY